METQTRARRFLTTRGFREIMRTFTPVFDPRAIHLEPFQLASKNIEKLGLELRSLAQLGDSDEMRAKLARLHHAIYADTHVWNPAADLRIEAALETFMSEDLIPDAMFVALLDGEPVGISSDASSTPYKSARQPSRASSTRSTRPPCSSWQLCESNAAKRG
jgi:hypothetical protein